MVTGFDIWGHDAGLRRHWKHRFLAFFVDAIISFVPVLIIFYFLEITDILRIGIIVSIVFYFVSNIPESMTGSSIGKKIFGLQVHAVDGGSVSSRVCIRNLSRLFWFSLLPLDFAIGLATRGDPRQKMMDRLAGTKVVHIREKEIHQEHLEILASASINNQKANEKIEESPESSIEENEDKCRDCQGKIILLADEKLQCEDCGLVQ